MKKLYRRSISGLLALLICFTAILGSGVTAFAAAPTGETADSYSVAFPRDGDANLDYSGTWGHDELHYMNGWTSGEATWMTTLHTIGSFDGPACYCIEPGVPRNLYRSYESYGEDYWDTFPAEYNRTIDGRAMKTLLGRIMQYGYQGNLSLDWRSQNEADADKLAHMMATQVLVWETVVGERDADFNHVDPGSADAVKSVYRTSHPLYSRFSAYYDSIEASVKKHTVVPSFMDRSEEAAQTVELSWDGGRYTATLTDTNGVLGEYAFSSAQSDMTFAVDGNDLTISAETASADGVTITAVRNNTRQGVLVWSDGHYGPDGTMQDVVTFRDTVSDPMYAYLHLKVSYGSVKIVKTSEDGEVSGISFTVSGNGTEQTVTTNADGEMQLDDLRPGVYTVTEQSNDRYEPQEVRQVTVISGQVATVAFHNMLKRGSLEVVKTAEDGLNEGVKFHLTGTSLAGLSVDEYAVTGSNGKAVFSDVLIGTDYILSEVDTGIRYVVPEDQTTAVEWNTVTQAEVRNVLKKWSATVTKRDAETGLPQGDATLAGAVYGVYRGEELVDTYTTDESGQFTTTDYVCGNDWTIRELSPSEGYLYQLVESKQRFIAQIMTSKAPARAAEDVDETALSYAEIKALATGNPQIIEKCNLDMEVSKLNMLRASHLSQRYALEELVLRKYPAEIKELSERIAGYEQDSARLAEHPKPAEGIAPMVLNDVTYAERENAGKAIIEACTHMNGAETVSIGSYRGFSMLLSYDGAANEFRMVLKGKLSHTAVLGADAGGNVTRIDNALEKITEHLANARSQLAHTTEQLENARTEMTAPFPKEAELAEKTRRLNELNVLLNLNEQDRPVMADEPDEGDRIRPKNAERER